MEPRTIGRALGIGVRVAWRLAGQGLAAQSRPAAGAAEAKQKQAVTGFPARNQATGHAAARAAMRTGQAASRGFGGLLRPFRRVGGILWLEVTGMLFLLPVVFFAPALLRGAVDYGHTSDHKTVWVTAAVMGMFLYLGISSFWRARRR